MVLILVPAFVAIVAACTRSHHEVSEISRPSDERDGECTHTHYITDEACRALVLQGCNLDGSAKGASGLPAFGRQEVLDLASVWGFNFVRYLIFWSRIEPEPWVYDESYLDQVKERLDWLNEAGILAVLDMHQDVWGPFAGNPHRGEDSDGAPQWATIVDSMPYLPLSKWLGGWAFDYLSPDVMRAFDNFWDYHGSYPHLQDHYAAMWAHVARRFMNHPAVLGYDLMNEPWQGTHLGRYRAFDEGLFTEFNQRMIDAIRGVDTEHWIFIEPCAFVANQGLPSYLGKLHDPRRGRPRLAYFPHLYPLTIELGGGYNPHQDLSLKLWQKNRMIEQERLQMPLLVGEWSMLNWYGLQDRIIFFDDTLRMFESTTSGWAYWDCGFFFREPFPDVIQPMLTRPYPRRIAGAPVSRSYEEATGRLSIVFRQIKGVEGPTEIYLGADRNYPDGWVLTTTDPEGAWSYEWDEARSVIRIWTDPQQPEHTISIFPASSSF